MIGQRRFGVLGQALLLLGVIPLPPPREPEVDVAAAEKAMRDLAAAGISGSDAMEAAGSPHRFVETAQKCLSMQGALAAQGPMNQPRQPATKLARPDQPELARALDLGDADDPKRRLAGRLHVGDAVGGDHLAALAHRRLVDEARRRAYRCYIRSAKERAEIVIESPRTYYAGDSLNPAPPAIVSVA